MIIDNSNLSNKDELDSKPLDVDVEIDGKLYGLLEPWYAEDEEEGKMFIG